jgi:nitroreductase
MKVYKLDVFEAVKKRRSIRAYLPTPIPKEKILKILEAARLAPSAGNIQPWHFIVVKDSEKKLKISKGRRFARFLAEAPVVIVGCGNAEASPKWYMVDVAIAMQNMVLTATNEGLGTCWVGDFNEKQMKELLKIPENYRVVALLAIGYQREKFDVQGKVLHMIRKRKKLKEIISFEEFGANAHNSPLN